MSAYTDKLRDPRWQKKRLEAMQRDNWACVDCGNKKSSLNVHHKKYKAGIAPWEYNLSDLETLCHICHAKHHGKKPKLTPAEWKAQFERFLK